MPWERDGYHGNRCQHMVAYAVPGLSLQMSEYSVVAVIYSTLGVFGGSWGQTKLGDDIRHLASSGAMATDRPSPALC